MATATPGAPTEMAILSRIIDSAQPSLTEDAARALLRMQFNAADRKRINHLAERNRAGTLTAAEEAELSNYIRAGQTLGILQSKARRSLSAIRRAGGVSPLRESEQSAARRPSGFSRPPLA